MTTITELSFSEAMQEGVLVLELRGAVDSAHSLEPVAERASQSMASDVVVVFSDVDYINSAGFGGLVRASDSIAQNKKRLFIVGLQEKVHLVFHTVGAYNILNILPTVREALLQIKLDAQPKA
jgi:anti-anti-sigma factor